MPGAAVQVAALDWGAYERARQILAGAGLALTALLLLLAAGLILFALTGDRPLPDPLLRLRRLLPPATMAALLLGFAALAGFHLAVRQALPLVDPSTGVPLARFNLPLWIEGEKLYFWAVLLGALALPAGRREPRFAPCLHAAWAGLILLALAAGNPFTRPLPRFDAEVRYYGLALLLGDEAARLDVTRAMYGRLVGFYNSAYMWIHPPLLFASYAALVPSFLASVLMLRRAPLPAAVPLPPAVPEGASPSPAAAPDGAPGTTPPPEPAPWPRLAYGYARLGYLLLTAGLLIGYPWTRAAWQGQPWWWDPKVNMSILMWVLYTAFLHAHLYVRRPGMARLTAAIGVASFAALALTYLTTYLVPGVHSYG